MPRFSPDGRWIVFWTGFLPTVVPRGLPGATGSIFIAPAAGGPAVQLALHFASARYPVWSPDSRHVLFLGEETASESSYDWYVVGIEDASIVKTGAIDALRRLRLNGATPVPGGWRAVDDAVVFATNQTDSSNVWQIQVSRSTNRVVGSPERLTFGSAIERAPGVAASGRIAFASVVEKLGIWRIRLDPDTGAGIGAFERVTDRASNERIRNAGRDGKVLSFISSRTGRDEVWIRDLETGRERQLTHAGAEDASLAPNGSTVAFSRRDSGRQKIQIIEAGAPPATLCEDCSVPSDWSPDGKRLLFHRRLPSELIVYDRSSRSEAVAIRHEKWSLFQARFSPDGAWVAFHTANSPEVRQVYAAPLSVSRVVDSEAWVPVVTDHGCHPNWSADGSLLYHFSFRDGAFCPWVQRMDPATRHPIGRPRVVQHLHEPRLRAALGAAATNDVVGDYLYMTASETTGNIWMLDSRR
jgi:Tol biopolymer transport system component